MLACENSDLALAHNLFSRLRVNEERGFLYIDQNLGDDWELIGEYPSETKIKAVNFGLRRFAKVYAPMTGNFSLRVFRALTEYQSLPDLPHPVLFPLAFLKTVFIFELGECRGTLDNMMERFNRKLFRRTCQLMDPIAQKHELTLAVRFNLIEIDGRSYMEDVFEDVGDYFFPPSSY